MKKQKSKCKCKNPNIESNCCLAYCRTCNLPTEEKKECEECEKLDQMYCEKHTKEAFNKIKEEEKKESEIYKGKDGSINIKGGTFSGSIERCGEEIRIGGSEFHAFGGEPKAGWEEKFDKKFGEDYIQCICEDSEADLWAIKSFIHQQKELSRKEAEKEFRKILNSGKTMYFMGRKEGKEEATFENNQLEIDTYKMLGREEAIKEIIELIEKRFYLVKTQTVKEIINLINNLSPDGGDK